MLLSCPRCSSKPWRPPGYGVAPTYFLCLHIVRYCILRGPRFASLRNGQWPCMSRKKRRGYTGQYQARKHSHRQDVLLDLFSPLGLRGSKHDALDLVVYASALLKRVRVRVAGKVVEVGLEEPEGLQGPLATPPEAQRVLLTSRAPLTDSSHRSIMNSSRAMGSLSTLMRR